MNSAVVSPVVVCGRWLAITFVALRQRVRSLACVHAVCLVSTLFCSEEAVINLLAEPPADNKQTL